MPGPSEDVIVHKTHRERNAGRKAEKKKNKKDQHHQELTDKQRNPKAFAFNSAIGAERRFRRKQDIDTKKQHIPVVDRTPLEPPPVLVAIVGPPKVGKSLLIQCLLKHYVKQPLTDIVGPVTIVAGKNRRVTFIECNNDINSMIDLAKIADLVLLLTDASFGFEMEIFEFLNICQVHGMPKIMGVLTHLDLIKNGKQMRRTKKQLKHRFWTEVYAGAKLFYLSGLIHEEYLRTEIKNLARFISVLKMRPLTWRSTHSYLLADRVEDLTNPELIRQNPKVDRMISLYGYVRGVALNKETSVHIPGCGDVRIKDVSHLPDPCPRPDKLKKRALVEKERLIYAPFSGVGGIVYDKDAVYVELGGSHSFQTEDNALITPLLDTHCTLDEKLEQSELQLFTDAEPIKSKDIDDTFGMKYVGETVVENGRIRRKVIFPDSEENKEVGDILTDNEGEASEEEESQDENVDTDDEEEDDLKSKMKRNIESNEDGPSQKKKRTDTLEIYKSLSTESDRLVKNKIEETLKLLNSRKSESECLSDESFDELSDNDIQSKSNDDDSEDNESEDEEKNEELKDELKWKINIAQKAEEAFSNRQKENKNLMKLIYRGFNQNNVEEDIKEDENEDKEEIGGIFKVVSEQQKQKIQEKELKNQEESVFFSKEEVRDWLDESNKLLLINRFVTGKWKESEDAEELLKLDSIEDEDVYGDFEDLETGEKHETENEETPRDASGKETEERKKLLEKKKKLKEQFDADYDDGENKTYYDELKLEAEKQAQLNKSVFEGLDDGIRVQLEGYRPGMYVRIEFESIPCELIDNFDPRFPLIVGGLLHGEENIGFVQTRVKKHRWYPKILKSRNPLILSIGWRRFQTLPIYSKLEDDLRNRMLKYTPEHVACMAHFWGPITPQGTGILAVQDVATREKHFRIAVTGSIVELDKNTQIVKKLKLTGVPLKIYKKTAFIKDMFNSTLEVAKFEGAKIKTVSGIRGQIKKAVSKPEGCFRATFEDRILLSDIVFCRTWYQVGVPKFYNPVTSLLLPPDEKNQWRGMKTTGQLKREQNLHVKVNPDVLYTPVDRVVKPFKPLSIPRKLQRALPYKDKPKFKAIEHIKPENRRVAVIREPGEEKISHLMKMIRTNYAHKQQQLRQTMVQRVKEHQSKINAEKDGLLKRQREVKKRVFRDLSKLEAKKNKNR